MSQALRRQSVVDELAALLRTAILDGTIPAGAPLREMELSERYAVARHTLRAALQRLAAEGIVVIEPHRGARVAVLDLDQLMGLFELRTALEVEAARLALDRNDGTLPPEVHQALARPRRRHTPPARRAGRRSRRRTPTCTRRSSPPPAARASRPSTSGWPRS